MRILQILAFLIGVFIVGTLANAHEANNWAVCDFHGECESVNLKTIKFLCEKTEMKDDENCKVYSDWEHCIGKCHTDTECEECDQ